MKVLTIFGTRPEIIRLSEVIRTLDRFCTHVLVHTGQNHDPQLSDVFFSELGVRTADHHLGVGSADGFAAQAAAITVTSVSTPTRSMSRVQVYAPHRR